MGRRNVSTYAMVGLGLKLEDLLKQKGLENKVTNSFEKLVDEVTVLPQNSANASAVNSPVDTRNEIANFANTSHDTVDKVKEIKNFVNRLSQNSNKFYNWVMSNVYFKKKIT
jgi:hypothetical protein